MPEYVRVKDKQTKHEMSLPVGSFDESDATVLDKDATDPGGVPLPVKYHTTVTQAADTSGRAATSKEK
jgi:hypothetical protein